MHRQETQPRGWLVSVQLISIHGQQGASTLHGTPGLAIGTTVQPERASERPGVTSAVAATRVAEEALSIEQRPCLHLLCKPAWTDPRLRRNEKSPRLSEPEFATDCESPLSFMLVAFGARAVCAYVCNPCARFAGVAPRFREDGMLEVRMPAEGPDET